MTVLFEDNHIIVVNKAPSEIVQGDKTGDKPLSETVKEYLKEKYNKPGNVFCGVTHRLDRPTSGVVVFARTSCTPADKMSSPLAPSRSRCPRNFPAGCNS